MRVTRIVLQGLHESEMALCGRHYITCGRMNRPAMDYWPPQREEERIRGLALLAVAGEDLPVACGIKGDDVVGLVLGAFDLHAGRA